ncbi:MAG: hypothetical protein F7C34_03850 [Desulfurococcales archaeon]|nr:hypothetical protein [Desulfurococcales archaeon]
MSFEEEALLDVSPSWSGLLLALAARGAELNSKRDLVFDRSLVVEPQTKPLIGDVWAAEAYIDTGSRSARSTSGVQEGFVLKTSILLRYWSQDGLEERILYPYNEAAPGFLLVRGDDRKRQASLYIAELAAVLALLRDDRPIDVSIDGPLLVVRHGSILQSIGAYFNKVFDLDRKSALAVLQYAGLNKEVTRDLVEAATVRRDVTEKVNPGVLAALLLGMIKDMVEKGGHTVIGLTEDVSVGRHLIVKILTDILREGTRPVRGEPRLSFYSLVDDGYYDIPREYRVECLSDFAIDPNSFVHEAANYLEVVARSVALDVKGRDVDREIIAERIARESLEDIVERIYEKQVLRLFNLASDSHLLLLYNYLYRGDNDSYNTSVEVDKSWLYMKRILKSYRERIKEEPPIEDRELMNMTSGVRLRYLFIETAPSCKRIAEEASRLGIDRRVLADMIRVIPPVRLEYYAGSKHIMEAMQHILAQSMATTYGVPPQLLVVDSRSRVNEWEYSALHAMLEELSKRIAPYSSFIRDFTTRTRHIL